MNLLCLLVLCFQSVHSQFFPANYNYSTTDITSVNGSSATGHCSNVTTNSDGTTTCTAPSSSVLFDRNIPTLTGLDGDMWASQLLTLQPTTGRAAVITFDFSNNTNFRLERLEVVMFNCPQRGTAVQNIRLFDSIEIATVTPNITHCDSLVRVCTPARYSATSISLAFSPQPGSEWMYLAELRFFNNSRTCPQDIVITTSTLSPDYTLTTTPSPPPPTILSPDYTLTTTPSPPPPTIATTPSLPPETTQVLPASYTYSTTDIISVNGSSATGHCSNVTTNCVDRTTTCAAPSSSVLFDGHIPTLTGLDGDMWASQLLTLQPTTGRPRAAVITLDFSNHPNFRVERLEVVMFNCPQMGTRVQTIRLFDSTQEAGLIIPTLASCDSLVRVCTPASSFIKSLSLQLSPQPGSERVYLAELRFFGNSFTCPRDIFITTPTTLATATQGITSSPPDTTLLAVTGTTQCEVWSTPTILASVISIIITALLTAVIAVLVQIAVCKCRPKSTPGEGTSAGEKGQEYEQMDGGEGGVAVSDPTYMEVGAGGGKSFELKQNEAYAIY